LTRNRDAERQAVEQMRAAVFAHYGESCSCCGTTDDLGIDHVNGDGKEQRIALFGLNPVSGRMYRWIIEQGFPEGFQTMCRPCNTSKGVGSACRLYHGILGPYEKWCSSCQKIRDKRTDFAKRSNQPDGLNIRCRECASATAAAWRERNHTHRSVSTGEGTIGGRVLAYLSEHGAASTADIARFLGITRPATSVNLGGLVREGHVRRLVRGMFCLPGGDDQAPVVRRVYERGPDWVALHAGQETAGKDWAAGMTWRAEAASRDGRGLR